MYFLRTSNIIRHFILALLLAMIVLSLSWTTFKILPSLGYGILLIVYIMIIGALVYFYNLMTYFSFSKSLLHFILNFILWCAEQVLLSTNFEKSFLYQDENYKILIIILGAILWTTNKLLLDILFRMVKLKVAEMNKLDLWLANKLSI